MPRKAKTESGHPAQARPNIPPQTYGEGKPMTDMTAAMPIPDRRAVVQPAQTGTEVRHGEAQAARAYDNMNRAGMNEIAQTHDTDTEGGGGGGPGARLMDIARAMPGGGGLLGMPTNRPNEPITAGLPSGPGPGPQNIAPKVYGNPTVEMLERLSMETKDPYFASLALRIRG